MNIVFWIALFIAAALVLFWLRTRMIAARTIKTVPQAGEIMAVSGGRIHYIDEGPKDAVTLVMIHGLGGNLHHFTYALNRLLSPEYRIISLDRPGTGYSSRDDDDLATLPEQARMIGELLDKLGVEKPVLVGHSLGGAISLAMALERGEAIAALALLCPLTHNITEPPAVFKPLQINSKWLRRLIAHTIAVPVAVRTVDQVLAAVFAPEPVAPDMMIRGGGNLGLNPGGFVAASADLMGATVSLEDLVAGYKQGLKTPGGILFGGSDQVLVPQLHGETMKAQGLACEILPGRGHMIPITAPEECAAFIRRIAENAKN